MPLCTCEHSTCYIFNALVNSLINLNFFFCFFDCLDVHCPKYLV